MEAKKRVKILIMGLENSGKSSIVLTQYHKDVNLLTFFSLKPTRGHVRSEIEEEDKVIVLWDFGGQHKYRERHLQHLLDHLEEADELVYVLDIQDKARYDEALTYYEDIMKFVELMDIKPKITFYIHKFDPNLENIDPDITNEFAASICQRFFDKTPEGIEFAVRKSTIYAIFEMYAFKYQDYL